MKSFKSRLSLSIAIFITIMLAFAGPASAQLIAYDDAGNYLVTANWTNGANQGFGYTPWVLATNGPDNHGNYILSQNNPTFVIASLTNSSGTNYTDIWGLYANGTNGINESVAFRGFSSPLGTNTFKLQWGSVGAGATTVNGVGTVHGWCGFTLRTGNATNSTADFQTDVRFYLYFLDGAPVSTLYIWDGNGVQSVPGTSFSDLGRNNITNAIEAELTPAADGVSYHLILKDCVAGRTIYTLDSVLIGSGTIDSAALFCHETTGDQVYNRMQIATPTNIPPTIVNVQPTNGAIYIDATMTNFSFEVDSFNSTISSNSVTVTINGVPLSTLVFNTASPTTQLLGTNTAALAPNTFYSYTIVAQDANGNTTTTAGTFNTFLATDLYIDAYDYNYNMGLFINSSTPSNAYLNLLGTNGIDYSISDLTGTNNTAGYRPGDLPQILSLPIDATGDPIDHAGLRAGGGTAYNIGFTDTGNWENYTRVIPVATNYSIYARAASAATGQFEIEELTNSTATTTNQPLAALGRINVPNTGGSKVFSGQLMPLTDIFGNTVVLPLSGTKTLRSTAISSRGYNIEYYLVAAVTNATGTLPPYISVGAPAPNSTGVGLASKITFTIANRNTIVTNTQLFVNTTNVSASLVLSSNLVGTAISYTPSANLPANATNTISVVFTDSANVKQTNTWTFVTAPTGGVPGNGVWSAGGGLDLNWSTAANWTGGTPGPGFSATFAAAGATATLVTNNIVSTNVTVVQLNYSTNNSGYHTTWIQDGMTLTVSNPALASITAAVQVGGIPNGDNLFNKAVTNTITGSNGTLLVTGPLNVGSNSLNFQVRQCASPSAPYQTTLDMSGLGTFIANIGKFYVAQGGSSANQSNVSGLVYLARTNTINLLRVNAGQFEVGDSSGGAYTLPGSALYLGITNTIFVDTMRIGKQKATNNLMAFNPAFVSSSPAVYIRGTNGTSSRVTTLTIGDADTDTVVPINVDGTIDLSGGKLDALVATMIVGEGCTSASDTGKASGILKLAAGTLDVSDLKISVQRAANSAPVTGTVNVSGTTMLTSTNIELAHTTSGATGAVNGTLSITNGTVRAGVITPEGGNSIVNINGGTLVVTNTAGTPAAPLTTLNLTGASLHLNVDGSLTTTNIVATTVTTSGTTTINIDTVANVTGPTTFHLFGYTGTDPFTGLTLGTMPAGYSGGLVDNNSGHTIDLNVNLATLNHPTIRSFTIVGGQVVVSGTNNSGAGGGTYEVLTSTNVATPLTSWTVLTNGTFDVNGNFSSTNAAATNRQRFYIIRVP